MLVEAPCGPGMESFPGTPWMIQYALSTGVVTPAADTHGLLHALAVPQKQSRQTKDRRQSEVPVLLVQTEGLAAISHQLGRSAEAGHDFDCPGEPL